MFDILVIASQITTQNKCIWINVPYNLTVPSSSPSQNKSLVEHYAFVRFKNSSLDLYTLYLILRFLFQDPRTANDLRMDSRLVSFDLNYLANVSSAPLSSFADGNQLSFDDQQFQQHLLSHFEQHQNPNHHQRYNTFYRSFELHRKYSVYFQYELYLSYYTFFLIVVGSVFNFSSFFIMIRQRMRK